jgi:hypothetical protein
VKQDAEVRLRRAAQGKFGALIVWHKAGATGQSVDSTWYEVERIQDGNAATIEAHVLENVTSAADVQASLKKEWRTFERRTVSDFASMLASQPGQPVPADPAWLPKAARLLAEMGSLGLVRPSGEPVRRTEIAALDDTTTLTCLFVEPRAADTVVPPPLTAVVHEHVGAQWDGERHGVVLHWRLPRAPDEGVYYTRVERYAATRGWEVGKNYSLSDDSTHEASRYVGDALEALDFEGLLQGELYFYYVFLVHEQSGRKTTYTLSQRCDVHIPKKRPPIAGEVETSVVVGANKLGQELERIVRTGKQIAVDARIRKVDVRIGGVNSPVLRTEFARSLTVFPPETVSADLHYAFRGDYSGDDVLSLARLLPRFEGASYCARLTVRADTGSESEGPMAADTVAG